MTAVESLETRLKKAKNHYEKKHILIGVYKEVAKSRKGKQSKGYYRLAAENRDERLPLVRVLIREFNRMGNINHANILRQQYPRAGWNTPEEQVLYIMEEIERYKQLQGITEEEFDKVSCHNVVDPKLTQWLADPKRRLIDADDIVYVAGGEGCVQKYAFPRYQIGIVPSCYVKKNEAITREDIWFLVNMPDPVTKKKSGLINFNGDRVDDADHFELVELSARERLRTRLHYRVEMSN